MGIPLKASLHGNATGAPGNNGFVIRLGDATPIRTVRSNRRCRESATPIEDGL